MTRRQSVAFLLCCSCLSGCLPDFQSFYAAQWAKLKATAEQRAQSGDPAVAAELMRCAISNGIKAQLPAEVIALAQFRTVELLAASKKCEQSSNLLEQSLESFSRIPKLQARSRDAVELGAGSAALALSDCLKQEQKTSKAVAALTAVSNKLNRPSSELTEELLLMRVRLLLQRFKLTQGTEKAGTLAELKATLNQQPQYVFPPSIRNELVDLKNTVAQEKPSPIIQWSKAFTSGQEAFSSGKLDAAETYFQKALLLTTANDGYVRRAECLHHLSLISMRRQKFDVAKKLLQEELNVRSNYSCDGDLKIAEIWLNLAKISLAESTFEKALYFARRSADSVGNTSGKKNAALSAQCHLLCAQALNATGDLRNALVEAAKVIELSKQFPLVPEDEQAALTILARTGFAVFVKADNKDAQLAKQTLEAASRLLKLDAEETRGKANIEMAALTATYFSFFLNDFKAGNRTLDVALTKKRSTETSTEALECSDLLSRIFAQLLGAKDYCRATLCAEQRIALLKSAGMKEQYCLALTASVESIRRCKGQAEALKRARFSYNRSLALLGSDSPIRAVAATNLAALLLQCQPPASKPSSETLTLLANARSTLEHHASGYAGELQNTLFWSAVANQRNGDFALAAKDFKSTIELAGADPSLAKAARDSLNSLSR